METWYNRVAGKSAPTRDPEQWELQRQAALEALAKNYTLYRGLSDELKSDPEIAKQYLSQFGWGLADVPLGLCNNPDIVCTALRQNPRALTQANLPALTQETVLAEARACGWEDDHIQALIAQKRAQLGLRGGPDNGGFRR